MKEKSKVKYEIKENVMFFLLNILYVTQYFSITKMLPFISYIYTEIYRCFTV